MLKTELNAFTMHFLPLSWSLQILRMTLGHCLSTLQRKCGGETSLRTFSFEYQEPDVLAAEKFKISEKFRISHGISGEEAYLLS